MNKDKYNNVTESLNIKFKLEIEGNDLETIRYDFGSNIPRLEKRLYSINGNIDRVEVELRKKSEDNGSYIGSQDAYNNSQEVTGNEMQKLSSKINMYELSKSLIVAEIQASKDWFKQVMGEDYVPYRSSKQGNYKQSYQRKTNNLNVSRKWWAKNGHKVEPVVEIGQNYPLEYAYNYSK